MRKVLKVAVTEENGQKFIQVIEQSHRGYSFGIGICTSEEDISDEFDKDGFTLASAYYPDASQPDIYCVRGDDLSFDNLQCPVPSDEWLASCLAAIDAYNEYEF